MKKSNPKSYEAIQRQIQALQKQADVLKQQANAHAVEQIKKILVSSGLSIDEVVAALAVRKQAPRKVAKKISKAKTKPAATAKKAAAKKGKPKAKVKSSAPTVKYKDQQGNTWSGRGPQPKWLKDGVAAGKNLTDFAA